MRTTERTQQASEYESLAPEREEQVPDFLRPAPTYLNGTPGRSRVSCRLLGFPEAQCPAYLPNKHEGSDSGLIGTIYFPPLGLSANNETQKLSLGHSQSFHQA